MHILFISHMYSMCNLTLRIHADQRQAGRTDGPTRAAAVMHGSSQAPPVRSTPGDPYDRWQPERCRRNGLPRLIELPTDHHLIPSERIEHVTPTILATRTTTSDSPDTSRKRPQDLSTIPGRSVGQAATRRHPRPLQSGQASFASLRVFHRHTGHLRSRCPRWHPTASPAGPSWTSSSQRIPSPSSGDSGVDQTAGPPEGGEDSGQRMLLTNIL